jgi:hypothetical protein
VEQLLKCKVEPLISSAQNFLTRELKTSRTWASCVADNGSGFREGMGRTSVPPVGDGGFAVAIAAIYAPGFPGLLVAGACEVDTNM